MIRRPPRSTLFPTRRSSDLSCSSIGTTGRIHRPGAPRSICTSCSDGSLVRSEEHTSELQSHHDLVCRLLLEKKKKKKYITKPKIQKRTNSIKYTQDT